MTQPTKPAAGDREIVCSFLELQNRSQQLEREQSPRPYLRRSQAKLPTNFNRIAC
jgi:hypothetical protein